MNLGCDIFPIIIMNIDKEPTEEAQQGNPYKTPEKFASATIHFFYGFSEPGQHDSVPAYLNEKKYALTADLVQEGFSPQQIEESVNSGGVRVAPVFRKRVTDLYWITEAENELDEMAAQAQRNCGGDGTDPNAPVGGDVASLGGILGSQPLALAVVTYAAHKGLLVETEIDRGIGVGPMYVSKDSPLASILAPQNQV